jgi:hypothetical protein
MGEIMLKSKFRLLVFVLALFVLSVELFAQTPSESQQTYENMLTNAQSSAVKDLNGRIKQISLKLLPDSTAEVIQFDYENNRLSTVIDSNGDKIKIQRDENGNVIGYIFPDGGKSIIVWDRSNPNNPIPIGFYITHPNSTTVTQLFTENSSQTVGPPRPRGDACSRAINAAGYAATAAVIACGFGPSYGCGIAVGAAALASYHAYQICNE